MKIELTSCPWCGNEVLNESLCSECIEEQEKNEERNKRKYNNESQRGKHKQPSWKNEQRWKERSKSLF